MPLDSSVVALPPVCSRTQPSRKVGDGASTISTVRYTAACAFCVCHSDTYSAGGSAVAAACTVRRRAPSGSDHAAVPGTATVGPATVRPRTMTQNRLLGEAPSSSTVMRIDLKGTTKLLNVPLGDPVLPNTAPALHGPSSVPNGCPKPMPRGRSTDALRSPST